jgi:hypothetical protein
VNGHGRIGNRPSPYQHEQQAGGRAGQGGIALAMTDLGDVPVGVELRNGAPSR